MDNVYADGARADAYAKLDFPGTYHLAFRDIPQLIERHVTGGRAALDFGCGAGRSTRFLERLGFAVTGVDIAAEMVRRAQSLDPEGDYRVIGDGDFSPLGDARYDLVLAAFPFDNVTVAQKDRIFRGLRGRLASGGRMVILVSAPEIYTHEWASFTTHDFPDNRYASDGDLVRIVMLDVEDRRPVEDVLCSDACYRAVFERAGLNVLERHRPLGRPEEPYLWVSETTVSPWSIYVLAAT